MRADQVAEKDVSTNSISSKISPSAASILRRIDDAQNTVQLMALIDQLVLSIDDQEIIAIGNESRNADYKDKLVFLMALRKYKINAGNEKALLPSLKVLMEDSSPSIRASAFMCAENFKSGTWIPIAIRALRDNVPEVRARAVAAIATQGKPSLYGEVASLSTDESPEVRFEVVNAVWEIDKKSSRSLLRQMVSDDDKIVREAARSRLLGEIN